jgi:acetylornithine deacetylase
VDARALVDDLTALVRVPSVTGQERAAVELVCDQARRLGLDARLEEDDLAALRAQPDHPGEEAERTELVNARVSVPGGPRRLALCVHVDVVAPGSAPWSDGNPYSGAERDGAVYGRGSVDMKAGVVAALHAMAAARDADCAVDLLVVSSEEDGGLGAFAALQRDAAYDACVIPEPTGFDVVCAQAGAITFRGVVEGVSAHAAERLHGVSAIDRYLPVHEALAAYEREVNADVEHALMRELELPYPVLVGKVRAGTWASQVPDRLEFEGRAPVLIGQSVTRAREAVEAAAGMELSWAGGSFSPAETDPGERIVGVVQEAAGGAKLAGVPWGADMRHFTAQGIPTVMIGTRGIERAHAVDEYVVIDEVVRLAEILERVMRAF